MIISFLLDDSNRSFCSEVGKMLVNEENCEKCESEIEDGTCQTCLYSEDNSMTIEEAREFTSSG